MLLTIQLRTYHRLRSHIRLSTIVPRLGAGEGPHRVFPSSVTKNPRLDSWVKCPGWVGGWKQGFVQVKIDQISASGPGQSTPPRPRILMARSTPRSDLSERTIAHLLLDRPDRSTNRDQAEKSLASGTLSKVPLAAEDNRRYRFASLASAACFESAIARQHPSFVAVRSQTLQRILGERGRFRRLS